MYLQPYINPRVQINSAQRGHQSSSLNLTQLQAPASSSLMIPGYELSRSRSNLLQIPGDDLILSNKAKSLSLNALADVPNDPPTIEVERVEDSRDRSFTYSSEESFSDSSSNLSNDSLCVSSPKNIRRCSTPQPVHLNPTNSQLVPSTSEPDVFKLSKIPKIPPRPQTQEILKRCTTVTRKNISSSQMLSPTGTDIHSR